MKMIKRTMRQLTVKSNDEAVDMIAQKLLNDLEMKNVETKLWYLLPSDELTSLALIFIAYKKAGTPRTLEEVSMLSKKYDRSKIYRRYKKIKEIFGMKVCETASLVSPNCIIQTRPEQLIERYGKAINLTDKTITDAIAICKAVDITTSPSVISATCLFIASNINKEFTTQRECADACGVSEANLRPKLRQILKDLDKINYWGVGIKREKEILKIINEKNYDRLHYLYQRRVQKEQERYDKAQHSTGIGTVTDEIVEWEKRVGSLK